MAADRVPPRTDRIHLQIDDADGAFLELFWTFVLAGSPQGRWEAYLATDPGQYLRVAELDADNREALLLVGIPDLLDRCGPWFSAAIKARDAYDKIQRARHQHGQRTRIRQDTPDDGRDIPF